MKQISFPALAGTLAIASFMARLDTNIVNIALPSIADYFGADIDDVSYVMLGFALSLAGSVFFAGGLADYLGSKRMLLAGYALFSAASLACSLAFSPGMLVFARCLQGMGSALLVTSAYSLISTLVPVQGIGKTLGIMTAAGSVGLLIGAPLGGFLTGWLSWRWIFYINIPFGILAMLLVFAVIPRDGRSQLRRFDWFGCLLTGGGLSLMVFGLSLLHQPSTTIQGLGVTVVGGCLIVLFHWWSKHHSAPVFTLSLFAGRSMVSGLLAGIFVFMSISAQALMMPFYLERVCGLGPQHSGAVFAVFGLATFMSSLMAGRIADKFPPGRIAMLAMGMGAIACVYFAGAMKPGASFWPAVFYLFLMGSSFGMFISPNSKMILSSAPAGKRGITTSVMLSLRNLGIAAGVAVTVILYKRYAGEALAMGGVGGNEVNELSLAGFRAIFFFCSLCCLAAAAISKRGSVFR